VNPSLYAKVPYDPVKDFAAVTLGGLAQCRGSESRRAGKDAD
jgi:hypothetical protein